MTSTGDRVAGKIAVVTGAGAGIGRATALRLAEEGAEVILASRGKERLEDAAREIEAVTQRPSTSYVLDVSDREAIDSVIGEVRDRFGRIDVLVNNAGTELFNSPSVVDTTDDEWEGLFRVNVTGMFRVCRAAIPAMPAGAAIVNLGSVVSFVAWPNDAPYCSTKGAVLQFSRALALELAPRGIRVNCLCPGIIDTPLNQTFIDAADDPDAARDEYAGVSPLNRMGTAREVANCALFLASDEASFVTGSAMLVDGGATAM
jgi:NAD(P)-dependent dehydrogenase (short-subunit alcohol dehydrogenase family)